MRLMLIIVLCCSFIVSCGHDDTETCLTSSELNMEDNPELSLKILKAINTLELTTERQIHMTVHHVELPNLLITIHVYSFADINKISVLTIFSPDEGELDNVMRQLIISDLDIPIYVDVNKAFQKQNPSIPRDMRFHYFLLDNDGKPLLIGNPITSDKIMRLLQTLTY